MNDVVLDEIMCMAALGLRLQTQGRGPWAINRSRAVGPRTKLGRHNSPTSIFRNCNAIRVQTVPRDQHLLTLNNETSPLPLKQAPQQEVGEHNITVNQVAPGWTISENNSGEGTPDWYLNGVALKRRGTDQQIANVVAFLASDIASYITSAYIPTCGGNVMPAI